MANVQLCFAAIEVYIMTYILVMQYIVATPDLCSIASQDLNPRMIRKLSNLTTHLVALWWDSRIRLQMVSNRFQGCSKLGGSGCPARSTVAITIQDRRLSDHRLGFEHTATAHNQTVHLSWLAQADVMAII